MDKELEQKIIVVMGFMGWEYRDGTLWFTPNGNSCKLRSVIISYPFHKDWRLIHSAWDKFRFTKISLLSREDTEQFYVHDRKIRLCITDGTELQAFNALYEAIKWFNQLNK